MTNQPMIQADLIDVALSKINNDCTNIDEVYNDLKSDWMQANPEASERDFIDSLEYPNGYDVHTINKELFTEIQIKKLEKFSSYLSKKHPPRTLHDHYKYYLNRKKLKFSFTYTYHKEKDFHECSARLDQFKKTYDYILPKLSTLDKIQFKVMCIRHLNWLIKHQELEEFKIIINATISEIEDGHTKEKDTTTDEPTEYEFKNEFDNIPEKDVYRFFKEKLVDNGYMNLKNLNEYLKFSFELGNYPDKMFCLKYNHKKDVMRIFYDYYKEVAGKPHGKQESYFNLLVKYFKGFEGVSKSNWAKTTY